MSTHHISGTIYQVEYTDLHKALEALLGSVRLKVRGFGYDMHHESERLRLDVNTFENDGHVFYLDADYEGDAADFQAWMDGFIACLNSADILYLIEHVEMDADGEEIGEEVSYAHPEFDARYVPPQP